VNKAPVAVPAVPAPRFLVLLGYSVWTAASIFALICFVALAIAILDPEPASITARGRFAFLALVAAVLLFHCVRRLRSFSRLHPFRHPKSPLE
jgi:uncharacterized membrane protein YphA (DoxX/SURF4 family)